MAIRKLLVIMDKVVRSYLGLDKESIQPCTVKIKGKKLHIINTCSFKRHAMNETWNEFKNNSLEQINTDDQEKLGLAIGKVLAKNLVVSFDDSPPIEKP